VNSITLAGLGGLAHPFLMGIFHSENLPRRISLWDDGVVEHSNLHRQLFFRESDVGRPKVDVLGDILSDQFIEIERRQERLGPEWVDEIDEHTLLIDATDGISEKVKIARTALSRGVSLVHGGFISMMGQVAWFPASGACLFCILGDSAEGEDTCSSIGVLPPPLALAGFLMSLIAEKALSGSGPEKSYVLTIDGMKQRYYKKEVSRNPGCRYCGARAAAL